MRSRLTHVVFGGFVLGGAAPAHAQHHPPAGRIRLSSSTAAAVRVIAPPAARLTVLTGAPGVRRGDTLLMRTPVELAATLAQTDVRVEVVGPTEVMLEAEVGPPPSTRRLGGVGRTFVLKAGGREIVTPGALDGIRELGGPPVRRRRVAFAPAAALSRAVPSGNGVAVYLGRPDTLLALTLPCPADARGRAAERALAPGVGGVDALLTIGPGAHLNGLGHAVASPRSPGTSEEGAVAGAIRLAGGCAVGDAIRVTVDSLVFLSRRLTLVRPASLRVTIPAP